MLRELCWYIQDWWMWAKGNKNCILYRIAVLLRLACSPSFELFVRGWHEQAYKWRKFMKERKEDHD